MKLLKPTNQLLEIKDKLITNLNNTYSPYSKLQISSLIIDNEMNETFGVNIENSSYGATVCAERSAIFANYLKSKNKSNFTIKRIYIIGKSLINNEIIDAWPCGICRQVISEFRDKDFEFVIFLKNNKIGKVSFDELLPWSFEKFSN